MESTVKEAMESAINKAMEEMNEIKMCLLKTHQHMAVESLDSTWLKYLLEDVCQDIETVIAKFVMLIKKPNE